MMHVSISERRNNATLSLNLKLFISPGEEEHTSLPLKQNKTFTPFLSHGQQRGIIRVMGGIICKPLSQSKLPIKDISFIMSTKTLFRTLFHGAVTVMYFCALIGYEKLPPMPHKRSHEHYAGRWKYLTYWNLIAQFLYFALSFIVDFIKAPSSNYQKLTKIRDRMYAGIVMPYGMFVVSVFWILYSIDRELIFPKVLDAVFPAWLNHVSHTMIFPALLLETYILRHRHPRRKDGIKVTLAFGLVYVLWVLYLALVKDIWPYPILYLLNWGQRVVFFGAGMAFIMLMYMIGEKINTCSWGDGIISKAK